MISSKTKGFKVTTKTKPISDENKKRESIYLECQLTDPEKLAYSKQLAEAISLCHRAEDTLESFKKQQNAVISGHESTINLLSDKINTGREYRFIECAVYMDYKTGIATVTRNDTGEFVKERRITDEERQENLSLTN